jgi:hypothetical protein
MRSTVAAAVSLYSRAALHPAATAVRLCNLYSAVDHQRLLGGSFIKRSLGFVLWQSLCYKEPSPPPHPIQKLANLYAMEILDTVH